MVHVTLLVHGVVQLYANGHRTWAAFPSAFSEEASSVVTQSFANLLCPLFCENYYFEQGTATASWSKEATTLRFVNPEVMA